jgi:hypothetical protein
MEFKFSCKAFEISFSGDPGFVETQIQKYEPHILEMLKKIEEEPAKELKPPEEEKNGRPYKKNYNNYNKKEKYFRDKNKKSNYSNHRPYKDKQSFSDEYKGAGPETEKPVLNPEEVEKEFTAQSVDNMSIHDVSEALCQHEETKKEFVEAPPIMPEFLSRRRAPRIKAADLKATINNIRPRTHHDRVMVFGYYMEVKAEGSDFTIAEINKCYRIVKSDPGLNIEQVITHATRSGFISKYDKGRINRYQLTNKGKRYVKDGLKLS